MKAIQHLKKCSCFWKPSVARKITLYFTIFGLLIFYLTSVAYLIAAKKQLVSTVARLVQSQLSHILDSKKADSWLTAVDQKQPELRDFSQVLLNLSSGVHAVTQVSIYGKAAPGDPWQRLRLDSQDVLRATPADDPLIA